MRKRFVLRVIAFLKKILLGNLVEAWLRFSAVVVSWQTIESRSGSHQTFRISIY